MELWVEERGQGEGRAGRLEVSAQLGRTFPVSGTGSLSCQRLWLEAELLNVLGCVVSIRYEGGRSWQDLSVPDQFCPDNSALIKAISDTLPILKILPRQPEGLVDIQLENYRNNKTPIQFRFNANLAALLGVVAGEVFTGGCQGQCKVDALVEKVVVVSPLVKTSASFNASQLRSLGVFGVSRTPSCLGLDRLSPAGLPAAPCLPALLSDLPFSINSLLIPSLVLRAKSFRILACFALSYLPE